MPDISLTQDQVDALKAKVQDIVDAKDGADKATAAANVAADALAVAQNAASAAKVAKASADGQVTADLQDLLSFVEAVTGVAVTTITPTPDTTPQAT